MSYRREKPKPPARETDYWHRWICDNVTRKHIDYFVGLHNQRHEMQLPYRWAHFTDKLDAPYQGLQNRHCYGNSMFVRRWKQKPQLAQLKLCVGVAVALPWFQAVVHEREDEHKLTHPVILHAWNMSPTGLLWDWTWGRDSSFMYLYLGWVVPERETRGFVWPEDVKNYLLKRMEQQ